MRLVMNASGKRVVLDLYLGDPTKVVLLCYQRNVLTRLVSFGFLPLVIHFMYWDLLQEEVLTHHESAGGPPRASNACVTRFPDERKVELPSQETEEEQLGTTGGVGPLPGRPSESGVASLPEERVHSSGPLASSFYLSHMLNMGLDETTSKPKNVIPGMNCSIVHCC
jgi:hypothetical protein